MGISSIKGSTFDFNQFTSKVERHISDVKKNKSYLSKGVSSELRARKQDSANFFAGNNIKALSQLNAFSTAFTYDKKARFINGVNQASTTNKALNKAVKDGEELKVKMDELVKQFEQAKEQKEVQSTGESETDSEIETKSK
jgi:hypothetical protein